MELLLTLGIFVITFWVMYISYIYWARNKSARELEIKTEPMLASLAFCGVFIPLALLGIITVPMHLSFYIFFIFGSLILLYGLGKCASIKTWYIVVPVLCYTGTFVLQMLIPELDVTWYGRIGLTLFWSAFIGLICEFDKIPCCSVVQGAIWGVSALLGFLLFPAIPTLFTLTGCVVFAATWGIIKIMAKVHKACFGIYLAALISFLWGGLFTFALMDSKVWTTILMLNTYIFAATFGVFLSWRLRYKFKISRSDLIEIAYSNTNEMAIRCVVKHCGLLSVLGIIVWEVSSPLWNTVLIGCMLIVFIDLYLRLLDGGAPAPGVRQIFSSMYTDLKKGLKSDKTESTATVQTINKENLSKTKQQRQTKKKSQTLKKKGSKRKSK